MSTSPVVVQRVEALVKIYRPNVHVLAFHGYLAQLLRGSALAVPVGVSASANSAAYMRAGFDRAIVDEIRQDVDFDTAQKYVQRAVSDKSHGYLPQALVVRVDVHTLPGMSSSRIATIFQTCTMNVPEKILPQVVFDCTWNLLVRSRGTVSTLVMPAFGAGFGGVDPETVARNMVGAIAIFHAEALGLAKLAAVLRFIGKDVLAFGPEDARELEDAALKVGAASLRERENELDDKQ